MSGRRARGSGSIYYDARRGRWAAVVEAGYDPLTGQRRRLTRHYKTQREAVSGLSDLRREATRRAPARACDRLAADYAEEYVRLYKRGVRPHTAQSYAVRLGYIRKYAPALRLRDMTTAAIQAIINNMTSDGYARETIRKTTGLLCAVAVAAVEDGIIDRAPMATRLSYPPPPARPRQTIGHNDYMALRREVGGRLNGLMPLVLDIARYMGLRRAEIMGMMWDNLDRAAGLYRVTAQLDDGGALVDVKTRAARRVVPVPPQLLAALDARRKTQAQVSLARGISRPRLIICRDDGTPYNLAQPSEAFADAARAVGLAGVTLHSLRHTYASDMAARVDTKTLQALLGHTSAAMSLDVYAESDPARVAAAVCPMP